MKGFVPGRSTVTFLQAGSLSERPLCAGIGWVKSLHNDGIVIARLLEMALRLRLGARGCRSSRLTNCVGWCCWRWLRCALMGRCRPDRPPPEHACCHQTLLLLHLWARVSERRGGYRGQRTEGFVMIEPTCMALWPMQDLWHYALS